MSWSDVGDFLVDSLPVVGAALTGGPVGAVAAIGTMIAKSMGVDDDPDAVMQKLKSDPNAILKYKLGELETRRDILTAAFQANQKMLETVNATMRNENQSEHWIVFSWRPFFGYCMAFSWFIQMVGVTYILYKVSEKDVEKLIPVIQQMAILIGALMPLWAVGMAVVGVTVHKRSQDKQINPSKNLSKLKQIGPIKSILSKFKRK